MPEMELIRCLFPSAGQSRVRQGSSMPFQTDIFDGIELVDNRWWTLAIEYPDHLEDRPQVFLLQYEERPEEEGSEGAIWCYPEDLDAIIAHLTVLRDTLRQAARDDAERLPRANWGTLLRSSSESVE